MVMIVNCRQDDSVYYRFLIVLFTCVFGNNVSASGFLFVFVARITDDCCRDEVFCPHGGARFLLLILTFLKGWKSRCGSGVLGNCVKFKQKDQ